MRLWALTLSIFIIFNPLFADSITPSHCFNALSIEEKEAPWAKEYLLGVSFGAQEDYEEALHCFKRSLVLCPKESKRVHEIEYAFVLTHYFQKEYKKAIDFFESHSILYANQEFTAYHDLLVILYHCYEILGQPKKADIILEKLQPYSKEELAELKLTGAVLRREFDSALKLCENMNERELISSLTHSFLEKRKSETLAKWFNALLPGLGYYYLGQKKAALTAFLINGALIIGAAQLILNRYYTLGCMTALLETGWYFGGIFGAKRSAYLYNESLFANYAEKIFYHESLNPQNKLYYEF